MLFRSVRGDASDVAGADERGTPPRFLFAARRAANLLNPKVGIFFVTFLPAFVPHGADVGLVTLALGMVFTLEAGAYLAVIIGAADRVTRWMSHPRTRRRLDRAAGVVLIGFGVRLATEQA